NPRKQGEQVFVPLAINLSEPASKAFQVELQLNADTVEQLIANGQLENTVALPPTLVAIPSNVSFAFGSKRTEFEVSISIGFLERNFGKNVAFAYRLVNPGKGNSIAPHANSTVVVLNTADILQPGEIRYLSITNGGGGILEARNRQNYLSQSGGISIPLGITLAGAPGKAFTVKARVNPDTIATLIANGTLPQNTIALNADQVTMDTIVRVGSNISAAPLNVFVQWPL